MDAAHNSTSSQQVHSHTHADASITAQQHGFTLPCNRPSKQRTKVQTGQCLPAANARRNSTWLHGDTTTRLPWQQRSRARPRKIAVQCSSYTPQTEAGRAKLINWRQLISCASRAHHNVLCWSKLTRLCLHHRQVPQLPKVQHTTGLPHPRSHQALWQPKG